MNSEKESDSAMFPFYMPWDDAEETVISLSSLLDAPAGKYGFVKTRDDGHLYAGDERIKFWGVNVSFQAAFPEKSDADKIAAHMAKYGINIVRFHHMDMGAEPVGIWTNKNPDRIISAAQLDKLDYFIAALKKNGIYSNINLLVSRPFNQGTELHEDINKVKHWKERAAIGFFDNDIMKLQKKYASDLLQHINPYTGNKYSFEPAVACVEINNENGMLHEYLSGTYDRLPDYYHAMLQEKWNLWLTNNYNNRNELVSAWNISVIPKGPELLKNRSFDDGLKAWNCEMHEQAQAEFTTNTKGPENSRAAEIQIVKTSTKGWHIQLNQSGLDVAEETPYTLSFWAKASTNREIEISIAMGHSPWEGLGFRKEIRLGKEWKEYIFPGILLARADDNTRINFSGMGLEEGKVTISAVSLSVGGTAGLNEAEDPWNNSVQLFTRNSTISRTRKAREDWIRFILSTEESYWKEMYRYLKEDINVQQPVIGTIIGCSTPNLMANTDIIDTHAYWTHPVFPGISWDQSDWYIENRAMINSPRQSTIADIALRSIYGKPHSVTEYNHPYPNSFDAETFILVSAYASFQDWDMVLPFTYSHRGNDWDTGFVPNYFDIDQHPVKMASIITASRTFLEGHIKAANETIIVPLSNNDETVLGVDARPWSLLSAKNTGLENFTGLIHRVRLATEKVNQQSEENYFNEQEVINNIFRSDTAQLVWDASEEGRGIFTAITDKTLIAAGFLGNKKIDLGTIELSEVTTLQNGFAVISISEIDDNDLDRAKHLLITALGAQTNTNMNLREYPDIPISFPPAEGKKITAGTDFGKAPTIVEGVHSVITLIGLPSSTVKAWALDSIGNRTKAVTIDGNSNSILRIGPEYNTVWYEVEINN